jgi:hypothetical protein
MFTDDGSDYSIDPDVRDSGGMGVQFVPANDATAAMIDFFGPPISSYSRAQAIEDGVLVPTTDLVLDEPDFAKQAGWKVPVALTSALADLVMPNALEKQRGQSIKGRLWDVLLMARTYGRSQGGDTVYFPCLFLLTGRPTHRGGSKKFRLKAVIGPGDDLEPVMTVMFENED